MNEEYMKVLESFLDTFEKAKLLVEKIDEVSTSQDYIGVFALASVHGFEYNGPNFFKELEDLREAIVQMESLPKVESE